MSATTRAEKAADIALAATGLAIDAKKQAEQHAETAERLAPPDPHELIVRELASHEHSALLNIGPKRHRCSELQAFDEQLVEVEQRREQLRREIGELMSAKHNEPLRVSAALDSWLDERRRRAADPSHRSRNSTSRSQTSKPSTERSASAMIVCWPSVPPTWENRRKMLADMREEVEAAASEYRALVDQLEETRRELLELRASEVWTAIYPSETLASEPSTAALVGAKKALQGPVLPGLESGLVASSVGRPSALASAEPAATCRRRRTPSARHASSRTARAARAAPGVTPTAARSSRGFARSGHGRCFAPRRINPRSVAGSTHGLSRAASTAERPPPRLARGSNGREGGAACTTSPRHGCC